VKVLWFTETQPLAVAKRGGARTAVGAGSWIESLRAALAPSADVDLAIAAPGRPPFAAFTEDSVSYYALGTELRRPPYGGRLTLDHPEEYLPSALTVIRKYKPDVIHVHGTEGPFGLLASLQTTPCVVSLQGLPTVYVRFYFSGESAKTVPFHLLCGGYGRASRLRGYLNLRRRARAERAVIDAAQDFIGRTAWDRAVLHVLNPRARYWHCDEIMRPVFYQTRKESFAATDGVVFCTTSDPTHKGTECLLEAFAMLRRASRPRATLRIAGFATQSPAGRTYARLARSLGVEAGIEWLGRLDAQRLANELAVADVFAYPTHIDNSPNALAEAMLVGLPCVATYVGGIPSMIDDGRDGLLVPSRDPFALAGGMRALLDDRDLAQEVGLRARATALQRHDPERVTRRMLEIYHAVADGGGS
jgi:glycosyltransferase involved in cell wall biosynthesis